MAALHGLPLDATSALPYVIRTGEPQFIPNREDYIRRWPHGAMMPCFDQLDSDYAPPRARKSQSPASCPVRAASNSWR
ncbi:hypothetical protein [Streptomyces sp. NPDC094472]|uniref:hypothetical protein n=1 Tax=unclassified Streptomyces TaxID=2593676 RepID=UPI00331E924C